MNGLNSEINQLLVPYIDEKYRSFALKLLPPGTNMLGVRLPILRKIARKVVRTDWFLFINKLSQNTYEERLLFGIVIAYAPIQVSEKIPLIRQYLVRMNNWSLCDSFCVSFKLNEADKKLLLPFLEECLQNADEYIVRFGIIMLLTFYIETNLQQCLELFQCVTHRGYYVSMGIAWAVSICYIRFREQIKQFLSDNQLDNQTHNRAIRKIRESTCLDKTEKDFVLQYKRN